MADERHPSLVDRIYFPDSDDAQLPPRAGIQGGKEVAAYDELLEHADAVNPHPNMPPGNHPDLAAHDALGLVTDAELTAHAEAVDPHPNMPAGNHPDLATHDTLGLATQGELDAHEQSADPHTVYALETSLTSHAGAADPHTGYQRESEKGVANGYAALDASGFVPDAQIPSTIARDSELPDLAGHVAAGDPHPAYALDSDLTSHAGAADPHTGYVREADANWVALTDAGETSLHSHAGGGAHPDLATHDTLGLATDAELASHVGAADPHTVYQKESEKGAASGYASLDSGSKVPIAEIPTGTSASTVALGDAAAALDAAHVAAGDPHTVYQKESEKGAASGYASLDSGTKVPIAQIPTGTSGSTVALGDAAAALDASHVAAGDPHPAYLLESVPISRGGTLHDVAGVAVVNLIVWRAPFACTVTNVRGYRVGGTGATINARKNGASNHLASALSLTSADSWMDGGSVQNTAYAVGDKMEIMVVSVTGTVTQVAIQVDLVRA